MQISEPALPMYIILLKLPAKCKIPFWKLG